MKFLYFRNFLVFSLLLEIMIYIVAQQKKCLINSGTTMQSLLIPAERGPLFPLPAAACMGPL